MKATGYVQVKCISLSQGSQSKHIFKKHQGSRNQNYISYFQQVMQYGSLIHSKFHVDLNPSYLNCTYFFFSCQQCCISYLQTIAKKYRLIFKFYYRSGVCLLLEIFGMQIELKKQCFYYCSDIKYAFIWIVLYHLVTLPNETFSSSFQKAINHHCIEFNQDNN